MSDDGGWVFFSWISVGLVVWLCSEPRIYPESVTYAVSVCEHNGGWKFIEEGVSKFSSVTCENGAEFHYDWNEILKETEK